MAKGRYWLDTNVFIDAKSGLYGFDLVPKFWKWLEDQMKAGKICSSQMIYDEICSLESQQDELYKWTKQRRKSGYWLAPDKDVQAVNAGAKIDRVTPRKRVMRRRKTRPPPDLMVSRT